MCNGAFFWQKLQTFPNSTSVSSRRVWEDNRHVAAATKKEKKIQKIPKEDTVKYDR